MKNIKFFKERKIKEKEMVDICTGLQYLRKPKGSYVIRYGEEGDNFYIILQGKVSVWIPMQNSLMIKVLGRLRA